MKVTLDFINAKFYEFNSLIFNSELKVLPIKLTTATSYLGKLCYKKRRTLFGTTRFDDVHMLFSGRLDFEQSVWEDTIIHEMIHYYILSQRINDTSSHGKYFRSMMKEINIKYHRNISISYRPTPIDAQNNQRYRKNYVCISRFTDGKIGITVAAHTRIFYLWDQIATIPGIMSVKWYGTTDPFFNKFPRSQKLKVYAIGETDLNDHLHNCIPLHRHGNNISTGIV